ncbi:uncharacterized protein SAPINGB_P003966 [Magnusiomyces paraingens]|uniref:Major facilitator superfamily (MFS) profile domain-containing protein n=1 Tax=Magnusiomyces paraingens TaxID=2606893 RepID=A0A5E8BUA6_9ASCO|nr:uncharacterized protein SAPINGB_P003966 [Saprochaete ingens]VVT54219.1 unnamed protein product [Saprochaete ingens]
MSVSSKENSIKVSISVPEPTASQEKRGPEPTSYFCGENGSNSNLSFTAASHHQHHHHHNLHSTISNVDYGAAETMLMEGEDLSGRKSPASSSIRRSREDVEAHGTGAADLTEKEPELEFDRGYAWVVLIAGTMINAFSWGASGAFGVFLATFLDTNKYPGATRMDFAFVGGLQFGLGLMVSPFVVQAIQKISFPIFIIAGSFVLAAGNIAASFATRIWHLYLTQGLLSGVGIGMVFVTANAAVPMWFVNRRGIAYGIFTCGAGLGSIIFSLSVQSLIDRVGLAWAQRYVGFMTFGFCILSGIFIKERRSVYKSRGANAYNFALLKRPDILLAIFWGIITMLCYGIVLYTMAPYAVSVGLTHHQGSVLSSVVSAGIVIGRPVMGHFADKIGSLNIALVTTLLSTVFILAWWIPSKSYGSLIALSFCLGSVVSSFSAGFPPICASLVDLEDLSAMMSMSWTVIGALNIFSTPVAIGLTTVNDTYLYSQIFTGLLFFVSSLILVVIRGIEFRMQEQESDEVTDQTVCSSKSCTEEGCTGLKETKPKSFIALMFKVAKV